MKGFLSLVLSVYQECPGGIQTWLARSGRDVRPEPDPGRGEGEEHGAEASAGVASPRRGEHSPPPPGLESSVSGPLRQALRWDRGGGPRHRRGDSEAVQLGGQWGAGPGLDGL